MPNVLRLSFLAVLVLPALAAAQNPDVTRLLGAVRDALGGDALASIQNLSIAGTSARVLPDGRSRETVFEMAMEMPDKFARRDVLANLNGMDIARTTGFSGDEVIERTDVPPQLGGMMVIQSGPDAASEALGDEERRAVLENTLNERRHEFTRLALGMFGDVPPAYQLQFTYAGVAEAPDGKADMLDVTGPHDFAVRLFVDQATHLPLMLSWMDKEPLAMVEGGSPQAMTRGGGAGHGGGSLSGSGVTAMSAAEAARLKDEMATRLAEAESRRRTVEFRLFYTDYEVFDGVRLPTRIQRMVDGQPVEELAFDTVTVNGTIDPATWVGGGSDR